VADPRFFRRSGPFSLESIAQHVGASLSSSAFAARCIHDVAPLDVAGPRDVSLFSHGDYRTAAVTSRAGAIITNRRLGALMLEGNCLLLVADPRLAFALVGILFYPDQRLAAGIHATALVDCSSSIGDGCQIDAGVRIGRYVTIGPGCHIEANAVICDGVSIGRDSLIGANSTVRHALIGSRVRVGSNSCIGGEGFGFLPSPKGLLRQMQLGRVIIEDNVEIGSNSAVDRGSLGDTRIGHGTVIDNLVQIAHNVRIGRHCVVAGQAGIAGSTEIGDNVMIGGQAAIVDHVKIGSNARIAARSGIIRDVPEGSTWGGAPAVPIRQWHRQSALLTRLVGRKANGTSRRASGSG
jgi:UDP-3-O-[3-hydroxymyristoyl] glucosamine N-acyltransferase